MLEQFVWYGRPTGPQRFHCPFEIAAAIAAGSITLAGFGLDASIEIGAFIVVVELRGGHGVSTDGGGHCRLELG